MTIEEFAILLDGTKLDLTRRECTNPCIGIVKTIVGVNPTIRQKVILVYGTDYFFWDFTLVKLLI